MAQKINPISLRLGKTNRSFDSSWFNDSNYGNLVMKNLKIQWYINSVLKKIQYCSARYTIQNLPNKTKINVFFFPGEIKPYEKKKTSSFFLRNVKIKTKINDKTGSQLQLTENLVNKSKVPFAKMPFNKATKNLFKKFAVKTSATDTEFSINEKINLYFYTEKKIINKNIFSKIKNYNKSEFNFMVDLIYTIKKFQNFYIKYFLIKHFSIFKNKMNFLQKTSLKKKQIKLFQKFENKRNFLFLKIYKEKNKLYLNNLKFKLNDYKFIFYKTLKKKTFISNNIFKLKQNSNPNLSFLFNKELNVSSLPVNLDKTQFLNKMEKRKKLFFTLKLKLLYLKITNILNFLNNFNFMLQQSNINANSKIKNKIKFLPHKLNSTCLIPEENNFFKNYYNFSLINNQNYNFIYKNVFKQFNSKLNTIFKNKYSNTHFNKSNFNAFPQQKNTKNLILINTPYKNHIESVISKNFSCNTNIHFFKTTNVLQSATFFIDEIIYYLEKKIPFFKIRNYILMKLTEKSNLRIKGMRIVISGRIGGKSKKAQRSKIQNFKYGQTSLHVFSSKIDFQKKNAITTFGTLGVKLWVCYL